MLVWSRLTVKWAARSGAELEFRDMGCGAHYRVGWALTTRA